MRVGVSPGNDASPIKNRPDDTYVAHMQSARGIGVVDQEPLACLDVALRKHRAHATHALDRGTHMERREAAKSDQLAFPIEDRSREIFRFRDRRRTRGLDHADPHLADRSGQPELNEACGKGVCHG